MYKFYFECKLVNTGGKNGVVSLKKSPFFIKKKIILEYSKQVSSLNENHNFK